MAKPKRKNLLVQNSYLERKVLDFAKPRLLVPLTLTKTIADARLYRPQPQIKRDNYLKKLVVLQSYLKSQKRPSGLTQGPFRAFNNPSLAIRMATCQSRHTRKEVLHALKRTGKGSGSKPRRHSWKSAIKC
ncbi:MAG: hypothetical protein [Microviridae sp. ctzVR26]|nr:MAG: hypothetical protein [Microviridae sp. ctzVR26]